MPEKPNKRFAEDVVAHRRAWTRGTPEFAKRLSYPGTPVPPCADGSCVNRHRHRRRWEMLDTHWMCPACAAAVPLLAHFYTHAPSKTIAPLHKQRAHAVAVYAVWLACRAREAAAEGAPAVTIELAD